MSKTYCRFCELHFIGLYLNCPKCGKWLAPTQGSDTAPDPDGYELAPDQDPFNKRKHIDPSTLPPQIADSMAVLAAFVMYTQQPNMKAGIEVTRRFFKVEITEVESKEVLEQWNGEQS